MAEQPRSERFTVELEHGPEGLRRSQLPRALRERCLLVRCGSAPCLLGKGFSEELPAPFLDALLERAAKRWAQLENLEVVRLNHRPDLLLQIVPPRVDLRHHQ